MREEVRMSRQAPANAQAEPAAPPERGGSSPEAEELIRLVARPLAPPRKPKPKPKPSAVPMSLVGVLLVVVIGYGLFRFATAYGVGYERSRLADRAAVIGRRYSAASPHNWPGCEPRTPTAVSST